MLKKIILMLTFVFALIAANPNKAQAAYPSGAAIGASLFAGYPNQGLALVGQFDGVPLMFGVQVVANILNDYQYFGIGATMDWWGFQKPLGQAGASQVNFYLGPGAALDIAFGSYGRWHLNAGLRMPIGFSFLIKNQWEIFLEPAPTINVLHANNDGVSLLGIRIGYHDDDAWWIGDFLHIAFQVGFRYWF